jgi:signal transduction histidine kinase
MEMLGRHSGLVRERILAAYGSCVLLLLAAPCFGANEMPRRVLMLHAFNYSFPATGRIAEAARRRLQERSPGKIEIDADFLDLVRISDPAHELRTANFLRDKYSRTPPDLVMTLGSAALPFIVKHRDAIVPKVPVVFTGVSPANYASSRPPPDVTGIISEFDLDKTLALAERLQPDTRRVVVVAGSARVDRLWQETARRIMKGREPRLEPTYLFELGYDELVGELKRVPRDSIVIILTVFADAAGKTFVPSDAAAALAAVSPAPAYAPYDTYLGRGTVGGFVETFESVGVAAADLALEILAGRDPATLPPRTNPAQGYRVDRRAMDRWGLREGSLPPGTAVLFKQPTIWDEHRDAVLIAAVVFALQSAFLCALLLQRHRRKLAEGLLKESDERMTFAAASANIGLWQYNRDNDDLWATEHSRALLGLRQDVALSRDTFLAAVHPEDRAVAVAAIRQAASEDDSAVNDVRVVLPGDRLRWIRIRARLHGDERGASNQSSGIFIDITEQKAAEAEAALQHQEVAHLMRVSVLGQLSGAIAHEINQPLTAILSNAQAALHLLAHNSPDLAEVRDALQDIVDENNRAGEVIQRLRNLLRKSERRSEPVDLNELVGSAIALLNNEMIGRRIGVKSDLARDLPPTLGDPVQLQQVLLNLVINAMDAVGSAPPARRVIGISTHVTRSGAVEVQVRDRGGGIRRAEQARLFEPFYTTKSHGLGLGLTICSTIIQAHGGTLTLTNAEGGGALAGFTLPAHEALVAAQ